MFVGLSGIPGLFYPGVSVDRCVTDYYKEHNFKDFEIISTMDIKAADIDRITRMNSWSYWARNVRFIAEICKNPMDIDEAINLVGLSARADEISW